MGSFFPRGVLAVLFVALPWLNPFAFGPSPGVQPWLASMACAIALWLLAATGGSSGRLRPLWPALAVIGWAALTHLSVRPELVFLAAGVALVAVVASISDEQGFPEALQAGFLLAASISALFGLCQYFGLAAALAPWVNGADAGEAYANLRQPNQFATLCWIGAAVVVFGTLRLPRGVALALLVLLAAGSAASASRTGLLIGVMLTLLAMLWGGPQRGQRLLLCAAAAVGYVAATWLLPFLLDTLQGAQPARTLWGRLGGGEGCSSRLVLWSNVLHLIGQKPLAGWGWGELDFAHYMTLYREPRFCDILDNAHNLPLHLAVELGLPVTLLACGGAVFWAWRQRPWREAASLRQLAWALLALLLLHSMLEYPLWYGPFQMALGASLGWLLGAPARQPGERLHGPSAAVAGLLLALTGFAAWDYERVSQIYLPPEERRAAWSDDTLEHARRSWLFAGQARFADLTLAFPTAANAGWMYTLSGQVLHYSPEPRVIERVIESAAASGREDEAVLHLARYRAAFPKDSDAWRAEQRKPLALPLPLRP
jgi:O-antigen ligase